MSPYSHYPDSKVFGLTRMGLEPTIYRTWSKHSNQYTTDVVICHWYLYQMYLFLSENVEDQWCLSWQYKCIQSYSFLEHIRTIVNYEEFLSQFKNILFQNFVIYCLWTIYQFILEDKHSIFCSLGSLLSITLSYLWWYCIGQLTYNMWQWHAHKVEWL